MQGRKSLLALHMIPTWLLGQDWVRAPGAATHWPPVRWGCVAWCCFLFFFFFFGQILRYGKAVMAQC
ncbi:hypothetical protein F5Y10DRAFT_245329, partial [Nemania abortiva]